MTDRDMLEMAAKAAGRKVRWHENWGCFVHEDAYNIDNPPTLAGQRMVWTPLTDDGDALRLAVDLCLRVTHRTVDVDVTCGDYSCSEYTPNHPSVYAATRRAIVRAAAEIGRSKHE